jgi:hypothetical protein
MRRTPDPGQGCLFAPTAEPETRHAIDPHIPPANHAYQRRGARSTSAAAAVGALPRSGTQRARVYEAIRTAGPGGLTDQEIAVRLAMAENSVRPRRLELSDPPRQDLPRLIVDSGRRRQTSAGKLAAVWIAIEHAEVAGTVVA